MVLPAEYEIITSVWEVFTAKSAQWTLNREVMLDGTHHLATVMNIEMSPDGQRVFIQDENGRTAVDIPYAAVALEKRWVKRKLPPQQ